MRRNKGITLIALVITIIVLLILAGVAISMLSGENGILKKAGEAKTKTEESQKEEDTAIESMSIATHFLTTNSKYKCSYGYITGIEPEEKVGVLSDALPNEYKIYDINKTSEMARNERLTTGMVIMKDGQEVARTVIFGDVNCDGGIAPNDASEVSTYLSNAELKPYQIVAGNVYEDDELNCLDANVISQSWVSKKPLKQESIKVIPANKLKRNYKKMQEFVEKMDSNNLYGIQYDDEKDIYTIKGIKKGTKFGERKNNLPSGYEYSAQICNEAELDYDTLSDDTEVNSNIELNIGVNYTMNSENYKTDMIVVLEIK